MKKYIVMILCLVMASGTLLTGCGNSAGGNLSGGDPSGAVENTGENIGEEKAGTVYYSEPNRIILSYQDAQVSAEYTPIGYFDYTDEFLKAVQDNPVLDSWGNKIILISAGE